MQDAEPIRLTLYDLLAFSDTLGPPNCNCAINDHKSSKRDESKQDPSVIPIRLMPHLIDETQDPISTTGAKGLFGGPQFRFDLFGDDQNTEGDNLWDKMVAFKVRSHHWH
ncbi:hypothetical protein MJO28_016115 [Puccinia striiformis f. sp. tritici]|uniref:Uncharacterized protein n=1 Tax=Puccinia striiformis f. sp. tritici TaxID=168172 RepID=A0ACC0DQY0_9BASI|nr:hypothetical protein MJO28_016115 [Puccinia striiformis f. sp. tritici]